MNIQAIKTKRISALQCKLTDLLDEYITDMQPGSILAITSKVVSLCEGSVVARKDTDKKTLVRQESDKIMPPVENNPWGINFTVRDNTLIPNAGIDESNADNVYVLWPKNAQQTANNIRRYLQEKYGVKDVGVVITDSTVRPLRRGVSGIALSYSGFKPLRDYVQTPDLFGRPFAVSQADIVGGLAAAAVLVMGEGAESTPMVVMSDMGFVEFVDADPSEEELNELRIPLEEDLFAPFLMRVDWQDGEHRREE